MTFYLKQDHCGKIRVVAKNENGEDSKEVSKTSLSFVSFGPKKWLFGPLLAPAAGCDFYLFIKMH